MPDIRIINVTNLGGIWTDWLQQSDGGLDETEELATAIKLALLTDSIADQSDILPDPDSEDRRGWWGDLEASSIWEGWPIGCKCWLLSRAKITGAPSFEGSTVMRAEEYVRTALRPFTDKRICSAIDVRAERVGLSRIDVTVVIYRGPLQEIQLRFQNLWAEI